MSKKKSYMNSKNIIKEGFFDDLIRAIIPKSIQKNISKSAQQILKKELEKTNKELKDLEKKSKEISDRVSKKLQKQYGYKTNNKKVNDFIKKRI